MNELSIEEALSCLCEEDASSADVKADLELLKQLGAQIETAEKEIADIKKAAKHISVNSFKSDMEKGIKMLPPELQERVAALAKEIEEREAKLADLEQQYQKMRSYDVPAVDGDADVDWDLEVFDRELKRKLAPEVAQLNAELKALNKESYDLQQQAADLYNQDVDKRLADSGIEEKEANVKKLKAQNKAVTAALVKAYGFDELAETMLAQASYGFKLDKIEMLDEDENNHVRARISLIAGDYDFDDDAFDEEGNLTISDEDVADKFLSDVSGEYAGEDLDLPGDYLVELESSWIDGDLHQESHYYPGSMWNRNGDPGDPPYWDVDYSGDAKMCADFIATKLS